jgi:hypothetical protein
MTGLYKLRNHRAQVTPGFFLGIGIIMFLFILVLIFSNNQEIKLNEKRIDVEKSNECLKLANLINGVYINGPGTEITTTTDFLITTFNNSQISVEDIASIEEGGVLPSIAFLASEAGPSSIDFYNQVNEDISPDWYKVCFSSLDGEGCSWGGTSWLDSIEPTFDDLMDNLDNYNTIYLEDPTIYYATDYIERLENWVSEGNALILSEHIMCRERSWGSYDNTSHRCNPPGSNNDVWDIFGMRLHQTDTVWGYPNNYNVVVNDTDEAFGFVLGDQLSFEEGCYFENLDAENIKVVAKYRDYWRVGSSRRNQPAIAFWEYGDGKIFYFADFQVEYINVPEREFSEVLVDLISVAYYLIVHPEANSDTTCYFSAFAPYQVIYGDIIIKNQNDYIFIENVNSS